MPLITSKKDAKDFVEDLKRQIKTGTFFQEAELKNFEQFFDKLYMAYSREHKSELAQAFDEYLSGFGAALRITPGYTHVIWEAMVVAVHALEQPAPRVENVFNSNFGEISANDVEAEVEAKAVNA